MNYVDYLHKEVRWLGITKSLYVQVKFTMDTKLISLMDTHQKRVRVFNYSFVDDEYKTGNRTNYFK